MVSKILSEEFIWRDYLHSSFIYRFLIVVIIFLLMRHILGCGIFAYPQLVLDLGVPLPWFFIITGLFIVNHVHIIIFECYPGWLPSKTCWSSMGYFSLVMEDPPDLGFMRLDRCHGQSVHGQICGAVLRCGAVSLC